MSVASTVTEDRVLLGDSRHLAVASVGASNGRVVVHFHGTPSSRWEVEVFRHAADELGVRVIGVDRPGFGGSDPQPGRDLRSWAEDMRALADLLAVDSFAVHGVSGGSPYALACGALLADRVTRVGWSSGIVPLESPAAAFLPEELVQTLHLAAVTPTETTAALLASEHGQLARDGGVSLPVDEHTADGALLTRRPELAALLARSRQEGLAQGFAAMAEDLALFGRPWGFSLADVARPVLVTMGDEDGPYAAQLADSLTSSLPDAQLEVVPGGHLVSAQRPRQLLEWLCDA